MAKDMYKTVDFRKNFKTYLKLVSKYKWIYIFVIFITIIVEGTRVLERYLFKILLDKGADFSSGALVRSAFVSILIGIGVAYIVSQLIKLILGNWTKVHLVQKMESNVELDLKQKFFSHIVGLSTSFHTTHKTGSLISRLNRGINATESLTDFIIDSIAPLLLQLSLVFATLFFLDPISAYIVLATSIVFVFWGIFISRKRKSAHIAYNKAEDTEKGALADIFMNIESVKYYGKEKEVEKRYGNLSNNTRKKLIRFWNYSLVNGIGNGIILFVGTFFLLYFPIIHFIEGTVTLGTLSFIYTSYLGVIGPLYTFVQGIRRYYQSIGDFDTLFKYAELENEIKDLLGAIELNVKEGSVEYENVHFSYQDRGIVKNVSLSVKPGEKVALVGHSGSGKTTLIKLLYRLYDLEKGEIKIDGRNIKQFKQESLRSELSIVPQECILFDDSIYNNILFSNPKASKEEVFKAIRFAQLDRFVEALPRKENTIVGERGVKLSGGEKQRVSIARAILANKKILVLDEATSSLDSKTEFEIQQDLERLMKGRTSIIIAHRLSTIMKADKIAVMGKGRIVQLGKHNDLIRQAGIYRDLWNLQKGGYIKD